MAIRIVYDLNAGAIQGGQATGGDSYTITHYVDGVTGLTAVDKINAVIAALNADGFVKGAFADSASDAWLRDIQVRPIGSPPEPDKFIATLIYKGDPFSEVKIESGSTLSQISTNTDVDGNPVQLEYNYPAVFEQDEDVQGTTQPQGGLFDKMVPEATVTFRIRELSDPALIAPYYVGYTNSEVWRGAPPGDWLCTGITGNSDNSGAYFDNAYSFQRRFWGVPAGAPSAFVGVPGWVPRVVFIIPSTGKPPEDAETSGQPNSVKYPILYPEADFNTLFYFPN